jgi:hypothetical protein
VTLLDAIVVRRADEQLRGFRAVDEPIRHDRWAIKPTRYEGRRRPALRRACLAGDCRAKVTAHGYCRRHWLLVVHGVALDLEGVETAHRRHHG